MLQEDSNYSFGGNIAPKLHWLLNKLCVFMYSGVQRQYVSNIYNITQRKNWFALLAVIAR